MNYGRAIAAVAAARELTLDDVAATAGLHRETLARIARADHSPTCSTLEAICGVLRFPLFLLVLLASDERDIRGLLSPDPGKRLVSMLMFSADLDEVFCAASRIVRDVCPPMPEAAP